MYEIVMCSTETNYIFEIARVVCDENDIDLARDPKTGQFLADLSLPLYFLELCRLQAIPAARLLLELLDSLKLN